MITEDERFIEIQAILAFSNINIENCTKINELILELSKENQELKKQYENAVADYETTMFEKEQLKKQLEPDYYVKGLEETLKEYQQEMKKVAKQQKEFIKYMNSCIKELEKERPNKLQNTINLGSIDITKTILQKYKSIIGESDV